MKKLFKKLGLLFIVIIVVMMASPVYAQVHEPAVINLISVEVYRSVAELNDQLYLIRYEIDYAVDPPELVNETYIFRLMNGGLLLGTTTAYPMVDNGYSTGIASIYFDAASAPAWGGAYTMYLDGNPTLQWLDTTAVTAMQSAQALNTPVYTDETVASNNVAANDMTLLPALPVVGDAYYFGSTGFFDLLTLNIGTQGNPVYAAGATGWLGEWQYYDGAAWVALAGVVDNTVGFHAGVGNYDVTWTTPLDWHNTIVNGVDAYYVRYIVTEFNTIVNQPLGTQSWVNTMTPPTVNNNAFNWIDEGTVEDAQDRLTTRLRYLGTVLEQDWVYVVTLMQDSASGKVLTDEGEEYFTNSILNLRNICPRLFFQQMTAVEFESDILVAEYHSWGGDVWRQVYGNNWRAQTFTPSQAYQISGVQLLVNRVGAPNNLTISLRATAANVPAGADLATGTYNANTVTTDAQGEWIAIALVTGTGENYALTAGTTYAIVVRALTGGVANYVNWRSDTDADFDGGNEASSVGGVVWAVVAADMNFEILARGGLTSSADRIEKRNYDGWADYRNWAQNWGIEPMFLSTIIWIIMMMILIWAVALVTNAWDTSVIVAAICTTYGWRAGFVDTIFLQGTFAIFALLIIYSLWRRT